MPAARDAIFDEPRNFSRGENPPGVVFWFKVYALFMTGIFLICCVLSLIFLFVDPAQLEMDPVEAHITGGVMLVLGLALFIVFMIALISQPRPWVWVYDLVLICLGLTSACLWPVTIPLLIYWLKPEAKRHFGRT